MANMLMGLSSKLSPKYRIWGELDHLLDILGVAQKFVKILLVFKLLVSHVYMRFSDFTIQTSIIMLLGSLSIVQNIKRNYSSHCLNITFYQLFPPMCRYQRVMLICLVVKNVSFIHLV